MTALAIRTMGDPVLRTPSSPVTVFDRSLRRLVRDMVDTMYAAEGVGLAAPQVGVSLRLFVYDVPDDDEDADGAAEHPPASGHGVIANPVLELLTEDEEVTDEGCLSVPGHYFARARARLARVTGVDEHGEPVDATGYGYLARCFQHEVGHLEGALYVDGLTGDIRKRANRLLREDPTLDGTPVLPGRRRRSRV